MATSFLSPGHTIEGLVPPGSVVAIGGMHMSAAPMALVRELVRRRTRIGRLMTSPSASLQAELLVAADLVDELMSPYVGFEHLGLAPAFRRAVEGGHLRLLECDEGSLTHALYAGAGGLPFVPCPPGFDLTDIPRVNNVLYRQTRNPFTGEDVWAVRALRPDVAIIACREADPDGNVAFGRFPFTDRLMALAARRLVVQVERLTSSEEMASYSAGETIPGFLVDAIVVAAGGCHPTGSPGCYPRDEDAIGDYLQAARSPEGVADYIAAIQTDDEETYLAAVNPYGEDS